MNKFNALCNQILSESSGRTVADVPVGEIFDKGIMTFKKISKTKLLGLNGRETDVEKYADKIAKRSSINAHDFDLFVQFRTGKMSKEEFNSQLQNKEHARD